MPAHAAPIAKASNVYAVMFTPVLSARIGLSRKAAKARPHGERRIHHSTPASRITDT